MKTIKRRVAALLLSAFVCVGLTACGMGEDGALGGTKAQPQPTTVSITTGYLATDSWGYTGMAPVELVAPTNTQVLVKERTLLTDATNAVISETSPTRISFSADATTLPTAARASAPGTLVSYLQIEIGATKTALPALSATVDVAPIPSGQALNVYRFDPVTGKWVYPQTVVVSDAGRITFDAGVLPLYGIFR